jgi:hypothetical protein
MFAEADVRDSFKNIAATHDDWHKSSTHRSFPEKIVKRLDVTTGYG